MDGIVGLVVENNTEILGFQNGTVGSRGIIGCEMVSGTGTIKSVAVWYSGNTTNTLRPDYTSAMKDSANIVCYRIADFPVVHPFIQGWSHSGGRVIGPIGNLSNGTNIGDTMVWNGSSWVPSTIVQTISESSGATVTISDGIFNGQRKTLVVVSITAPKAPLTITGNIASGSITLSEYATRDLIWISSVGMWF